MAIGSPGIGSGLDIGGLVASLVAAERTPTATRLGVKEARIQAEISAFGSLKSALSSFQSSLSGLKDLATFQQTSASSGDSGVFKATSDETAVPGTFQIEVERLASFHKVISQGFADPTAAVGSGTLNIDVGGDAFSIALDGSESLEDIRDAINGASDNAGVGATIIAVDDGLGGTVSKLALTATESGSDGVISMTVNDGDDAIDNNDAGLSRLVFDANVGDTLTLDAQLRVDGELITSSTNKVTGAITGVTIDLVSATDPAEDITNALTISLNTGSVEKSINAFVKSYNSLIGVFNKLANFNAETGEGSILLGDSTLRRVRDQISREMISMPSDSWALNPPMTVRWRSTAQSCHRPSVPTSPI
jgi:flagellar hook-associated protein 2